jgi:hypothetical protein
LAGSPLIGNVINGAKLSTELLKILGRIIQNKHARCPGRIRDSFWRIKSANEYHRCLALGIETRNRVERNKQQRLVGVIMRIAYAKAAR